MLNPTRENLESMKIYDFHIYKILAENEENARIKILANHEYLKDCHEETLNKCNIRKYSKTKDEKKIKEFKKEEKEYRKYMDSLYEDFHDKNIEYQSSQIEVSNLEINKKYLEEIKNDSCMESSEVFGFLLFEENKLNTKLDENKKKVKELKEELETLIDKIVLAQAGLRQYYMSIGQGIDIILSKIKEELESLVN